MCRARSWSTVPQRSQIGGSTRPIRRRPASGRGTRQRVDPLEAVVQRREVPARALRADPPQPALPLVERETTSHPESRGPAVAVELAVAEGAGPIHQPPVASRTPQVLRLAA